MSRNYPPGMTESDFRAMEGDDYEVRWCEYCVRDTDHAIEPSVLRCCDCGRTTVDDYANEIDYENRYHEENDR